MSDQVQTLQQLGAEGYAMCEHQVLLFLDLYDIWGLTADLVVLTV